MAKSLTERYLDNLPIEIRYIIQQIIAFTQIVPPANIVAYKEYLARAKALFEIDKSVNSILYQCNKKDQYYFMSVIPLVERVNKIKELQSKCK